MQIQFSGNSGSSPPSQAPQKSNMERMVGTIAAERRYYAWLEAHPEEKDAYLARIEAGIRQISPPRDASETKTRDLSYIKDLSEKQLKARAEELFKIISETPDANAWENPEYYQNLEELSLVQEARLIFYNAQN